MPLVTNCTELHRGLRTVKRVIVLSTEKKGREKLSPSQNDFLCKKIVRKMIAVST